MEEEKMLTLEKFEEASEVVRRVTLETKLVYSDYFSQQTGAKVFFKPENLQFTGAYKVRGAYYKMSTLTEEERAKGVITASAGNHAQGVAYAAKCYGAKATIVMPMYMMKHAQRLTSWRKSMDILSYIPSMTLPLQRVREPLRWKLSKSFPLWIISSFPSAAADWQPVFPRWRSC